MAIQFQCAFCKQPIEVDDEYASRAVGCPYCKKTVNAPDCSTLGDKPYVPMASPASRPGSPISPAPLNAPRSRNTIAVVAFALACALIVLMFLNAAVLGPHMLEFQDLATRFEKAGPNLKNQLDAMNEFLSERGGVPPTWLVVASCLQLLVWVDWLAALVCGLIAVSRVPRRGLAIATLAICGGYLALNCAGLFL